MRKTVIAGVLLGLAGCGAGGEDAASPQSGNLPAAASPSVPDTASGNAVSTPSPSDAADARPSLDLNDVDEGYIPPSPTPSPERDPGPRPTSAPPGREPALRPEPDRPAAPPAVDLGVPAVPVAPSMDPDLLCSWADGVVDPATQQWCEGYLGR